MTNLDEALLIARGLMPGWAYLMLEKTIYPDTEDCGEDEEILVASISKSRPVKKIVYGVVIDPYGPSGNRPDAHGDWIPPDAIEETAHKFLVSSRQINFQHIAKANATLVESWVEQYPTPEDYQKALDRMPHKVARKQFGNDVVHSGSWVIGVQLSDELWNLFKKGEINSFSPGGMGLKKPIEASAMPQVEFVDLISSP